MELNPTGYEALNLTHLAQNRGQCFVFVSKVIRILDYLSKLWTSHKELQHT